jgi:hypothetical protein
MLLTGAWHYCPDTSYHIVETSDQEEPCEPCKRQREWKRQREEAERERQVKLEQKRRERKRASAQASRKRRKEREQEDRRRAEQGLPPLEVQKVRPVDDFINYQGHRFQTRKDQYGKPEVYCLTCEATWSRPPRRGCAGRKTYRDWAAIPGHLKTQTQLFRLHLKPAEGQEAAAVIDGAFDRYSLYDQNACVPVVRKPEVKKQKGRREMKEGKKP